MLLEKCDAWLGKKHLIELIVWSDQAIDGD